MRSNSNCEINMNTLNSDMSVNGHKRLRYLDFVKLPNLLKYKQINKRF